MLCKENLEILRNMDVEIWLIEEIEVVGRYAEYQTTPESGYDEEAAPSLVALFCITMGI